jgi:hypothetical protein
MPLLSEVQWAPGRMDEFSSWMTKELTNAQGDRAGLERDWADYIVQWRAKMPNGVKDFPWPGASNLEFPLTAMHADPIYADLLQTTWQPADPFHVKSRRPDRNAHANALRQLLTRLNEDFLDLRNVSMRAFLDLVVLGTCVYKVHWRHTVRKGRDYDENGEIIERHFTESRPIVETIPLQHFWIPANSWDIDPDATVGAARWVAQEFWLTENELNSKKEQVGTLVEPAWNAANVDLVLNHIKDKRSQTGSNDGNVVDNKIQQEDNYIPSSDFKVRLFEIWSRFDVDGDGVDEDVVTLYHLETGLVVRALHNPFLHGKRPFEAARYLPNFGFYGIGVAEVDDWAQTTTTNLLNGLLDNVTLVNSRMFGAPLGSNVDPDEPIYPGKIWFLGEGEKIQEIRMGDVYQSLPQSMFSIMQWADTRVGSNEIRQGNISGLPSRTPATSLIQSLEQGNKRFDMILGNLRDRELGSIGIKTLQLFAQYLREDPVRWTTWLQGALGPQDTKLVLEALTSVSPEELPLQFGVTITATSALANKEADKQAFLGLIQILAQVMPQLLQLTQVIEQSPPGSLTNDTAQRMFAGSVDMLSKLLERFDIENAEDLVPNAQAIIAGLQAQASGINAGTAGLVTPPAPEVGRGAAPSGLGPEQLGALFGIAG